MLDFYGNSLIKALMAVYPQHNWDLSRLSKWDHHPHRFWWEHENHVKAFQWIAQELKLRSLDDWYTVKVEDVVAIGGITLMVHYGNSLANALTAVCIVMVAG